MFLNLLKSAVLGVVAIGFPMSASAWDFAADELVYSYSNETNLKPYGTARQETYDLAVKLPDKALVGKKVVGVRIPFTTVNNLSDLSVWMTTELGIDQNDFVTNVTNICSQKAEFSNGQYIDVKFDKPYIITDEGVYVGYSFTVDKAVDQSETPIWCTSASTDEDGFWVHSSYTFRRWMSKAKETGLNLAMQVIIGGVEENSLGLLTVDLKNPAMGKSVVGEMTVQNHGSAPVTSFEYAYVFGENSGVETVTVPEKEQIATKRKYNTSYKCSFTLPAVNDKGEYPLSIELLKVNGQENKDASAKLEKTIAVASKVAAKIPVVEEYTGGWCGNCVRGIGSLNYMAENFEDFIGIAYHNNDAMEVLAQREFPESVGGFPYARFDRTYDTDIYYGQRRDSQYGLDAHWIELAQQSAPAEISVKAEWNGEDKSSIKVTSSVNFVEDDDFNLYTLAYVLLHDNMSGKGARWKQKNYYVGDSRFKFDPYMEQFVNGEEEMYPIYNEVMVACSDIRGIANSLPREVKADTPVEHEFIFNVNDVKNTAGQGLIQDKNKLRVAVLMIGSNRKIANAGKAFVPGYDGEALKAVGKGNPTVPRVEVSSSVQDLESEDAGAKIVAYYDMTGREIRNPENGVYIVRLSNGNTRKCVIRK